MKLIDFNKFGIFLHIREKMGITEEYLAKVEKIKIQIQLKLDKIKKTALEIDKNQIIETEDGTIEHKEIKNQKMILYKKNVRRYNGKFTAPKFHITWCQKMEDSTNEGTFDGYVVSQRTDGIFYINKVEGGRKVLEADVPAKLNVCRYCLGKLNYDGYADCKRKEEKDRIVENFNIAEFLQKYNTDIYIEPMHSSETQPPNLYPSIWRETSYKYRRLKNFICQDCGKDCSKDIAELHVHHKDGRKFNLAPSNLEVVCAKCHSKKPGHEHMLREPRLAKYLK